jgi:hypothetical protein
MHWVLIVESIDNLVFPCRFAKAHLVNGVLRVDGSNWLAHMVQRGMCVSSVGYFNWYWIVISFLSLYRAAGLGLIIFAIAKQNFGDVLSSSLLLGLLQVNQLMWCPTNVCVVYVKIFPASDHRRFIVLGPYMVTQCGILGRSELVLSFLLMWTGFWRSVIWETVVMFALLPCAGCVDRKA